MLLKSTRVAVGVLVALVAVSSVLAGGFQVQQQGAKAAGRGNAFTALADDASAVYYNPAAAARIDGWTIYLGGTATFLNDTTFTDVDNTEYPMQDTTDYAAEVYVTGKLSDTYSVAFGANVPYSMRAHWWNDLPVSDDALKTRWTSRDYNLNFVVAVTEAWSFAVGIDYVELTLDDFSSEYDFTFLEQTGTLLPTMEPYSAERNFLLEGNKAGYNLALHWRSENGYLFGVSYRSQRIVRMKGKEQWQDISEAGFSFLPGQGLINPAGCEPREPSGRGYCPMGAAFTDSPASANIVLPASFQIGFGREGQGNWDWEVDLLYTRWRNFDDISIQVDDINGILVGLGGVYYTTTDLNYPERWRDTYSIFAGADYNFTDAHAIRFGLSLDPSPAREEYVRPYSPMLSRGAVTVGYGYTGMEGKVKVDVFAQGWAGVEADATAYSPGVVPGTYNSTELSAGASFQYNF